MSQRPRHLIAVLADGDNTTWSGDAFVFSINDAEMARLMEDDKLARKWSETRGDLASNILQEMTKLQGELTMMEVDRDRWRGAAEALAGCDAELAELKREAQGVAEHIVDHEDDYREESVLLARAYLGIPP